MTIEEAVATHLVSDPGVVALVGTRVYQLKLPQSPTFGAVRVQLIDHPGQHHLRGPSSLTRPRLQVDVFAEERSGVDTYAEAVAIAEAADAALDGQRFAVNGVRVRVSLRVSRRVFYEADEFRLVHITQDYFVWARQT